MKRRKVPSYRLHKPSGQAIVTLPDGVGGRKDVYLGAFGSPESRTEYGRVIHQWETQPTVCCRPGKRPDLTVNELILAYWNWAQDRYVKDGKPTSEQNCIRMAIRFMRDLFGDTLAGEFGPLALKTVRGAMVKHKVTRETKVKDHATGKTRIVQKVLKEGLARSLINKQVGRIKAIFKWGVGEELLAGEVYHRLACVTGLRKGEAGARESAPIRPVSQAVVEKTLPHLPSVVADMVKVQRLSGARPGEIVQLRACDLDMTGPVWEFRPSRHKTEHHDRERIIFFGPQAQAVLRNYLTLDLTAPLFRPDQSEAARATKLRQERKTPLWPSHVRAQERKKARRTRRTLHSQYDAHTYRRAIARACKKACLPIWTPNQLRHSAATEIRKRYGLEAAQACLGHAALGVTQIYAEKDLESAKMVMAAIG